MAMTYQTLKTQVEETLARGSDTVFTSLIDDFIQQAQVVIARDNKFLGFLVVLNDSFIAGNQGVVQKPDRHRETFSFGFGSGTTNDTWTMLKLRTYPYIRRYWKDPTTTGVPIYYADYDDTNWLVGPTPDSTYPFEAQVYLTPQELTVTYNENWLTKYAPDMILHQTLLQAAPYLKNDERIQVWQTYYQSARESQTKQYSRTIVDRSQMVEGA
jgi:hypothetical protein|tara:strand:+ start:7096 stop:7734 length:639 start_codon:yes stop_codon:yes gene_type:complete